MPSFVLNNISISARKHGFVCLLLFVAVCAIVIFDGNGNEQYDVAFLEYDVYGSAYHV